VERTQIFFEFDLNEHSVLAALLIDGKDFCGDGSHLGHFLRLTSPEMCPVVKASGTERHQRRRESSGHSPLSPIKSSLIRNAENPPVRATSILHYRKSITMLGYRVKPVKRSWFRFRLE
jgi:hypothetical protein